MAPQNPGFVEKVAYAYDGRKKKLENGKQREEKLQRQRTRRIGAVLVQHRVDDVFFEPLDAALPASPRTPRHAVANAKALRNILAHGPSFLKRPGFQLSWQARKPRSGWGIMIVERPSADVNAVKPPAEPFGLNG